MGVELLTPFELPLKFLHAALTEEAVVITDAIMFSTALVEPGPAGHAAYPLLSGLRKIDRQT